MAEPAWDASAMLTLPFHPDAPVSTPVTLREAVRSWLTMDADARRSALLFFQGDAPSGEGAVIGSPRLAELASHLPR